MKDNNDCIRAVNKVTVFLNVFIFIMILIFDVDLVYKLIMLLLQTEVMIGDRLRRMDKKKSED